MKKIKYSSTFWQSFLSAIIFGVFFWFAISSIPGIYSRTSHIIDLGEGIYRSIYSYDFGHTYIQTGARDKHYNWQGSVTNQLLNVNSEILYEEVVNMVDDKRHGVSTKTFADGHVETTCYNMGEIVDCETQAAPAVDKESASEILLVKNPELVNKLEVNSSFGAAEVKAMLDTMQQMMLARTFDFSIFDTIYQDIQEELLDTKYDSIVSVNAELSFYEGIELSKYDEFRIAVINRYLRGDNSLAYTLNHIHSNYINLINSYGYTNLDIEDFCFVFDSTMLSYGTLDLTDPYLVDSLDNRMVRALLEISGYDVLYGLKSVKLNNKYSNAGSFLKNQYLRAKTHGVAATPEQVAQLVIGLVYYKYIEGDKIRKALMENYAYLKEIVLFPTVTTVFESRNSSSGVTISGNVTDDGGGDITTRGFVWGTVYNPNYRDNVIVEDPGTGLFQTDITGLTEGVTYYVRSFATNSAGTQYGNCIEFSTEVATEINESSVSDMELIVYPNPATDIVNIDLNLLTGDNIELTIFDLNGKMILSKKMEFLGISGSQLQIDVSGFENGVYNLRLTNGEKLFSQKLVVAQ